jgi:putative membrane protein
MHGDVGTGWMIVMMPMMLLFWGAIIVGIAWLIRGAGRGWSASGEDLAAREDPMEILDRRFAEGAISVEDYSARRKVLLNGTSKPTGAQTDELAASGEGERSQR